MALNARPILSFISAFDAEFGETDKGKLEAPVFKFSWTEGVVRKNRLRIVDYNTNEEVYNCIITTMSRTHQLHKEEAENVAIKQYTKYNLKNGHKYKAYLSVFTVDDVESFESEAVIFSCVATPIFQFTNFKNFSGDGDSAIAVVESSSLDCVVDYKQEDQQENLSSYYYELIDYNGKTIYKSVTKYVAAWNTTLRFSIGGVDETGKKNDGEIKYDEAYTIICVGETQHGLVLYAEQKFIVKVPVSGVGALIQVENVGDGRVLISSNYKIMDGLCSNENPKYVLDKDGNPYAIDLSQGDYVEFNQGFTMYTPYELIITGEFGKGKLVTLKGKEFIKGTKDYVDTFGTLYLKTIDYTTFRFYYFSFEIEKNGILYDVRSDYFRYVKELVSAEIDLSCYNGWYNIKANINYDNNYVAVDNVNDDVLLTMLKEYELSDEDGNIVLTTDSIVATDDEEGNITLI